MEFHHVGIAIEDTEAALQFYEDLLGFERTFETEFHGNWITFLDAAGTKIELLEPLGEEGTLSGYLETHGEGLHHVAVRVDDLEAELERLAAAGVDIIDDEPRPGTRETRMAFVHPRAANGVLLQLFEDDGMADDV